MTQPAYRADKPMLAVVLPFPLSRSCFSCEHWRGIQQGAVSWCHVYSEEIDSETYAAEDCGSYSYCEEGSQPYDPDLEEETE